MSRPSELLKRLPVSVNRDVVQKAAILGSGLLAFSSILYLAADESSQNIQSVAPQREITTYYPHWMINTYSEDQLHDIDRLCYFSLTIGSDGNFPRSDLGLSVLESTKGRKMFEDANKKSIKTCLTITQMEDVKIAGLLNDSEYQKKAIEQITLQAEKYKVREVNIDFEHTNRKDAVPLRGKFVGFIRGLKNSFKGEVSVAVNATSAMNDGDMFDVKTLGAVADRQIIMGYDFFTRSSKIVAPTAPLSGRKEGRYWYDVTTAVEDFIKKVDPKKLTLAIPLYGHDYPVRKTGPMASVREGPYILRERPTRVDFGPKVYTYDDIKTILSRSEIVAQGWDEIAAVGWFSYLDENEILRTVYHEDVGSISKKAELVQKSQLGGLAFWAGGYSKDMKDINKVLKNILSSSLQDLPGRNR